jgi:hypothetical protein
MKSNKFKNLKKDKEDHKSGIRISHIEKTTSLGKLLNIPSDDNLF